MRRSTKSSSTVLLEIWSSQVIKHQRGVSATWMQVPLPLPMVTGHTMVILVFFISTLPEQKTSAT